MMPQWILPAPSNKPRRGFAPRPVCTDGRWYMSAREAARILNLSENAIRTRIQRGLARYL